MQRHLSALVLSILLFGCATPYQATGVRGGFSELDLGKNRFLVTFSGNGYTSAAKTREFALRRAKEICDQRNMDAEFQGGGTDANIVVTKSFMATKPDSQIMVQCIQRSTANAF